MYENTISLFYHALSELGHIVKVSENSIDTGAYNILLPPKVFRAEEVVTYLLSNRIPYGFIGVETFDGFKHHRLDDASGNPAVFHRFVQGAQHIFCLFKQDIDRYRNLGGKAVYAKYGFSDGVAEIRRPKAHPIDVFFFGDVEGRSRRTRILQDLADRGLHVHLLTGASNSRPALVRNSLIGMAKINININHSSHVSPQRVVFLANNAIPCVSDSAEDPDGYLATAMVRHGDAELIDWCCDYVRSGDVLADGDRAYDILRQDPMSRILEAALDG
ncbi:hypothetical protein [Azospirillum isscasi]|uniref:Glycosyltransferase family 1 protein n=1 Tax=Azospirillum isscasi TaxID=3053926 RepID=A0ABU0WQA5_9PROT|nr:hypothetical protein [Azospirillum isscasi]MDQ2106420.1 hypothetical protein [Azospirillum isscasi]